jgi:hypothetical protein
LLELLAAPFLKDGVSVTGLTAEIPMLLGAVLNGEISCPEFGCILNAEAPPAVEPKILTPFFMGDTLNPDVPAFRLEATPLVGTAFSTLELKLNNE